MGNSTAITQSAVRLWYQIKWRFLLWNIYLIFTSSSLFWFADLTDLIDQPRDKVNAFSKFTLAILVTAHAYRSKWWHRN